MSFTCIGDSYPNFTISNAGKDAHETEGREYYHNVYAGPFCFSHSILFQHYAIKHYNDYVGYQVYTCSRYCAICYQESDD